MAKPKRTFTAEFKRDAIVLAEWGDRSVAQLERDLGLTPPLARRCPPRCCGGHDC